MSIFIGFLYVVEVLVCLLLAMAVMLQKPKEGGLGGAIGGGVLEASLGADAGRRSLLKSTQLERIRECSEPIIQFHVQQQRKCLVIL